MDDSGLREKVADVIPHAVHDGVVGWRRGLCVLLCSLRRCVSVRWLDWADLSGCADRPYVGNRLRDRGLSFDSTLVDQGRFYAYPPYQHDELRIKIIRRRLCFRAVGQRRHEDLIDRLLILGEFGSCDFLLNLWCGGFALSCADAVGVGARLAAAWAAAARAASAWAEAALSAASLSAAAFSAAALCAAALSAASFSAAALSIAALSAASFIAAASAAFAASRWRISSGVAIRLTSGVVGAVMLACSSHSQWPLVFVIPSRPPLSTKISAPCGTITLFPLSCCSIRIAPLPARTHITPAASNPIRAS